MRKAWWVNVPVAIFFLTVDCLKGLSRSVSNKYVMPAINPKTWAPSTLRRRNLKPARLTLKTHQLNVFLHTTPEEFEKQQSTTILERKAPQGKSHDYRCECDRFRKAPFSKCFLFTLKRKAGVFRFLRFKERFRKSSAFSFGLVWTAGLTVEIMLLFQISLA